MNMIYIMAWLLNTSTNLYTYILFLPSPHLMLMEWKSVIFLFLSNAVAVNYLLTGNKVKAITRRLIKLCHVKSENRSKIPSMNHQRCVLYSSNMMMWSKWSFVHTSPKNGLSCLCHIRILCLFPLFTQIRIFYLKFDL